MLEGPYEGTAPYGRATVIYALALRRRLAETHAKGLHARPELLLAHSSGWLGSRRRTSELGLELMAEHGPPDSVSGQTRRRRVRLTRC